MPSHTTYLADLFDIETRFRRSVHLERDARRPDVLEGYVVTPLARRTLARIHDGLDAGGGQRAWTLTGPYGSGKSAFATFLYSLLSKENLEAHRRARKLIQESAPEFVKPMRARGSVAGRGGLVPVLLTGEQSRLDVALLKSLQTGLETFWAGSKKPDVLAELQQLTSRKSRTAIAASEVVSLFETAASKVVSSSRRGAGLLVVIDELGKYLEYAARDGAGADVYLLQALAELATRSGDSPIVLVGTLHQAFGRYAAHLGPAHRDEWVKVQGRFEDIAFQEAPEQLVRLAGSAIVNRMSQAWNRAPYEALARKGARLAARITGSEEKELVRLLSDTAPLHPSTALVLGPIFRFVAGQNERSLFAFLSSSEPYGFQSFLRNTPANRIASFTIPDLYDYLHANLGQGLEAGSAGRHWALVEEALGRLPSDSPRIAADVVKTVGLLGVLGARSGMTASEEFLVYALEGPLGDAAEVRGTLASLTQSSHLVFRRYRNAYALWDGSDLDVGALVEAARPRVEPELDVARELQRLYPPRPLVAKRHLFETGTLRYFEVRYVDAEALLCRHEQAVSDTRPDGDGFLLYAIPRDEREAKTLRRQMGEGFAWLTGALATDRPTIVAVPDSVVPMREALVELAAIDAVKRDTPSLANDPVARRELHGRREEASAFLHSQIEAMFGTGRRRDEANCSFFVAGQEHSHGTRLTSRGLSNLASELCDRAFCKAPRIHNELLNRREVSSAAAAARRQLIEAMLERADSPGLALEGSPPEKAMYLSVLLEHGLHRKGKHGWSISKPRDPGSGLGPAWQRIEQLLARHEGQRLNVEAIYDQLAEPPYGLKRGVMPVLFAAVVIALESELAIYEDGAFRPRLNSALLERLARFPQSFEVQRSRIDGARARIFHRFADAFLGDTAPGKQQLVLLAKRFAHIVHELPPYARNTRRLDEKAVRVREAIAMAKEPAALLFQDLPKACGLPSFEPGDEGSAAEVERYCECLREALDEMDRAFDRLREDTLTMLAQALGSPATVSALRADVSRRVTQVSRLAVEPKLKSFIVRAADSGLDDDDWLNSLLTNLGGKPPTHWTDTDFEAFHARLSHVAREFRSFEALAFDAPGAGQEEALRLAIAQAGEPERVRVVRVSKPQVAGVAELERKLMELLSSFDRSSGSDLVLVAIGRVAARVLAETSSDAVESLPQSESRLGSS